MEVKKQIDFNKLSSDEQTKRMNANPHSNDGFYDVMVISGQIKVTKSEIEKAEKRLWG